MKTKETPAKDINVVYRKDGTTPDLRYKGSKHYVISQNIEKTKKIQNDGGPTDFGYKSLRDNAASKQTEKKVNNTVQIKPAGKKPLWKISH